MFKIYDGRETFYQWDQNQKLIVEDATINEVHFCNKTDDCALIVEVYEEGGQRLANVPNILLTDNFTIKVYGYCGKCYTKQEAEFKVVKRSKPSDYIYTETEVKNYEEFEDRLKALEEGGNIDLSEYVKNTDYATTAKGGVIKVDDRYGTRMINGILDICAANKNVIDNRNPVEQPLSMAGVNQRHTITPANVDYAVKRVLIDNKIELTEEEKAAALSWIGAQDKLDECLKRNTAPNAGGYSLLYAQLYDGREYMYSISTQPKPSSIPMYTGSGANTVITTGTPTSDNHCTNKAYVDTKIAELLARIEALEQK